MEKNYLDYSVKFGRGGGGRLVNKHAPVNTLGSSLIHQETL